MAKQADRKQQQHLGQESPAAPASQERQLVPVHQGRPQEFPGIGQPDQGEEADRGEVDAIVAQPGRHQGNQDK